MLGSMVSKNMHVYFEVSIMTASDWSGFVKEGFFRQSRVHHVVCV